MSINLGKILFSDSIWHYCLRIIALVVEAIKNVYSPGITSKISVVPWDSFNMTKKLLITSVLNRPSATHPSQIFLHFHSISLRWPIYIINSVDKNKLSSLERLFRLDLLNGLGWDFLRDSPKPFGWFSDSFTQVTKGNTAERFVKTTAILRFASTQSRRIPAVTHIKILSAEHAQTECPSATWNAKTWKSCFCFFTDGKQHKSSESWHDYP